MRHQAIEKLLPAAYQRAAAPRSVLSALLYVMEDMHAPDEAVLESVDDLFEAYRTRDQLLPFLARWLALDHLVPQQAGASARLPMPVGRLRNLVAEGAALAQLRGTPEGLRRTLEISTGVTGFTIEEPANKPYHFVVRVPPAAADQLPLIRRIVDTEKPAATTAEVPDPIPPTDGRGEGP
ncbi:MAG TPA: phage tail protein [Micromonosporaceae bacterium]|nr:phage tail protein [Micromonosporaceae bacterium]